MIGRAALDVLLRAPRIRSLLEQGGPDECQACLLVVQTLGRASPAIELAAAHFEVHSDASLVDYVDALGLEAMLGPNGLSADETFWTSERINSLRDAAFDVSWRAMTDPDARMVLCAAAMFDGDVPPTATMLALFTGLVGESEALPYARIEATLVEIGRRGWLETKLGFRNVYLRPYVQRAVMKWIGDWGPFVKERVRMFAAVFADIEKMEREVSRRGVGAICSDLRLGMLLAIANDDAEMLATRWRIFGRESHTLATWEPRSIPTFFLQQMRNRALDMAEDATKVECEVALAGRKELWLRERFRVNRESAALARTYCGHAAEVRCVIFRIESNHLELISGSDDRTIRLWDVVTGLVARVFEGHSMAITDLALTGDRRYLASASEDGTIRKWDLWTGTLVRVFEGHGCGVRRVAIESQGRFMVTAAVDNSIRIWDFENGNVVQTIGDNDHPVTWMALTANGLRAVCGTPFGAITVHQIVDRAWTQVFTLEGHSGRVNDIVMMNDMQSALSAADDGTVKLWDIENGRLIHSFEGHTGSVTRVIPSGDGRYAVSSSQDKTLRVWDIAAGKELSVMRGHTDAIWGVDVDWPQGIAVTASSDMTLRLWTQSRALPDDPIEGHTSPVYGLTISRDGRYAVSGAQDKTVCVWEISTGKLLRKLEGQTDVVMGLTMTDDGQTILAGCDDGQVYIWDFATGSLLRQFAHGTRRVRSVVVTKDGRIAVSACNDKLLRVWDMATGEVIRVLEGHTERVRCAVFTPDGQHLISASLDQTLRVWDWTTGKTVRVLQGHTAPVWSVAVTPDGRLAISASFDRTLRVWELATGRLVRTLEGHSNWVMAVAATPDGHRVFSTSQDTTVAVWDLETGNRIGMLTASSAVYCAALTPDGKVIAIGDGAGAVRFLDVIEDAHLAAHHDVSSHTNAAGG
jgi:WD40 repeat protein